MDPKDYEDHDQRFKSLLKKFIREFFLLFFPIWEAKLDWDHMEWLEQEIYIDPPKGNLKRVDLLLKIAVKEPVQISGKGTEYSVILLHVEIEAPESVAAFRPDMFEYFGRLRFKHELPVLPVALYLRVGLEGIGWDHYEESLWDGPALLKFSYPYVGLPALNAEDYLYGDNWLGVALTALMKIPKGQEPFVRAIAEGRLGTSGLDDNRRIPLLECVEAYLPMVGEQAEVYAQLIEKPGFEDTKMAVQTTYEKGIEKGIEKGQEVATLPFRRAVLRSLEERFGPLSESERAKVATFSAEKCESILADYSSVSSLAELGLE